MKLSQDYTENVKLIDSELRVGESFDVLRKTLKLESGELTLFFVDGFAKDTALQKLMMHFISVKSVDNALQRARRKVGATEMS